MSIDFLKLVNQGIQQLAPYEAGKPIEELERELGIKNIVKLASNENPLGISPKVKQAMVDAIDDIHRYPDANGFEFKHKISQKFNVKPDQITLGNGSNDLLELIAHTFVNAGDEVIFSQYAFIVYPLVTKAINATPVIIPALDFGHDLKAFLDNITAKTKMVFIANPNNPTGTFLSEAQIRDFLTKLPSHIICVLDEAYTEFAHSENRVNSVALANEFDNLIVCRTLSKAYGLAGIRLGFAISHPKIADLLNRVRQPFNCNSIALAAGIAAINDLDFINQVVTNNQQGMIQYEQFFKQKNLAYIPSSGNFITLDLAQNAAPIYQKLLEQGVIVRPIAGYGLPNHLRISIGTKTENEKCINALASILG